MSVLILAAWIVFLAAMAVIGLGAAIVREAGDRLNAVIGTLSMIAGSFILAVAIHLYHLAGLS